MFVLPQNLIHLPPAAPPLAQTFALIMQGLRQAVSVRAAARPARWPLLILVWARAAGLALWLARLAIRVAEGHAPPKRRPPTRTSPPETPAPDRPAPRERGPRLPAGHAWLFRMVPDAASYGSQLAHLLNQPEMAALLAAAPHAGRKLRALCRLLGVSWQNVTTLDLRPRPRVRPSRRKPPPDRPAPDPAEAAARRRALRRNARPRRAAPPEPSATPPEPPRPPPLWAHPGLPEALRPRPPPNPAAPPEPGAYPRTGWASLFMLRKEV